MNAIRMSLIASLVIGSGAAMAQSAKAPENYVGASLALYNKYSGKCDAGIDCKDNPKSAGKIFGGHNFDGFGIEGMLFTTGTAKAQGKIGDVNMSSSLKQTGLGLYAVLPLNQGDFTFKGKLGVGYVKANYSDSKVGPKGTVATSTSKSSFQPLIGAGVSYAINRDVSVHADWDRIRSDFVSGKNTTNMVSVGLSYKF